MLLSASAGFQLGLYNLTRMVRKQDTLMSGKITEATQLLAEAKKRRISIDHGISCPSILYYLRNCVYVV